MNCQTKKEVKVNAKKILYNNKTYYNIRIENFILYPCSDNNKFLENNSKLILIFKYIRIENQLNKISDKCKFKNIKIVLPKRDGKIYNYLKAIILAGQSILWEQKYNKSIIQNFSMFNSDVFNSYIDITYGKDHA